MKNIKVYMFDDKTLGATVMDGRLGTNGVLVNIEFEGLHIAIHESDLRSVLRTDEQEAMDDDRK